jgi:hypothetical protein
MRIPKIIRKVAWPIKAFKYKSLKGINSRRDFYRIIEWERERANRNNHQVSLAVFNLKSFPDNSKELKQLIRNIINEKRKIDELGWYDKHSVGVILPYTSSNGARDFSVRLSRTLNFIMPDSFCYLFTYPLEDNPDDDSEVKDLRTAGSGAEGGEHQPDNAENGANTDEDQFDDYAQNTSARSLAP